MLEVLEFAYCCIVAAPKKYCVLHSPCISSVAGSNNCSDFIFILLFISFSKHKALDKKNFLKYDFQRYIKIHGAQLSRPSYFFK